MRVLWYYICLNLARLIFFLGIGGMRSVGKSNVSKSGALIVAPLHVSNLDPAAVACGTNRRLRFMAKEELFKGLFGKLIHSLGAFPVKRGEGDSEAIRKAIDYLNQGEAVLVFPEGTRGDGKVIQPINRGVAMFAKRTGALVLPVGVIGTHIAFPKGQKKVKRQRLTIAYGEPFTYESIAHGANERENRDLFAAELQQRIVKLCNENGMTLRIDTRSEDQGSTVVLSQSSEAQAPS